MGFVYLIHLDESYRHARHYVGYAEDVDRRLAMHRRGAGSKLMRAVVAAGIHWTVAWVRIGDRALERRYHKRHGASRFCPLCALERQLGSKEAA